MDQLWACAVLALIASPGDSWDTMLGGSAFFRLLLYNDTAEAWNARTEGAFERNGTYTVERGTCGKTYGLPYAGGVDDTENLDLGGVNVSKDVFEDGCGIIYASEPTYYEEEGNRTWASGKITFHVGAGCTTREVNATWDNLHQERPGGGRHREYLAPVAEETVVSADGSVCYNETLGYGGGYPVFAHSLRMVEANCSLENATQAEVRLAHTCRGFVLLDSAYSVMGWRKSCRREYYIEKICIPNCEDANRQCKAKGGGEKNGGCEIVDCGGRCNQIADRICDETPHMGANCETPPSGEYGNPGDGSSKSYVEKPRNDPNDPCMCRYFWDRNDVCFNNRVTLAASEGYVCKDEERLLVDVVPRVSCNGSFRRIGEVASGNVTVTSDPDIATAFIFDDIPFRFRTFTPRHRLYRMQNRSDDEPTYKEYRLQDGDYRFNETHNDTGYFDFTDYETAPNHMPPTIGSKTVINGFWRGNGTYNFEFTHAGEIGNLTVTLLGVKDRIRPREKTDCAMDKPCANGFPCVDGTCFDPGWAANQTVRLGECLSEEKPNGTKEKTEAPAAETGFDIRPWLLLAAALGLLAVSFSVSEGKYKLYDFYVKFRRLLR